MANVRRHEMEIATYAMDTLNERYGDDICLHGPTNVEVRGATFSFGFRNIHPHDLSQVLDQRNVCLRAGHHCAKPLMRLLNVNATARASFYSVQRPARRRRSRRCARRRQRYLRALSRRGGTTSCRASKTCTARSSSTTTARRATVASCPRPLRTRWATTRCAATRSTCTSQVEGDTVTDVKVGGQGCSISQSSASMMSQAVKGRSVAEVRALVRRFKGMMSIEEELPEGERAPEVEIKLGDLEALQGVVKFPVRIKCATLAWNTLIEALAEATSA